VTASVWTGEYDGNERCHDNELESLEGLRWRVPEFQTVDQRVRSVVGSHGHSGEVPARYSPGPL